MIVTSKVSMNLLKQSCVARISAVQDDRYSRNLELLLHAGNVPWTVPDGAAVLICYSKADGKGGEYDVLPDGTAAWSTIENVLTVALAPQVLTVPGPVTLAVKVIQNEKQISTFPILIDVQSSARTGIAESEDYYHVAAYIPAPASAKTGQYLRISAVDEQGIVTGVEAVDFEDGHNGEADLAEIQRIVEEYLEENPPVQFETDETLILKDGILRVNTADAVEEDNTLPVTSAAVQTVVGNIGAILDTI